MASALGSYDLETKLSLVNIIPVLRAGTRKHASVLYRNAFRQGSEVNGICLFPGQPGCQLRTGLGKTPDFVPKRCPGIHSCPRGVHTFWSGGQGKGLFLSVVWLERSPRGFGPALSAYDSSRSEGEGAVLKHPLIGT